MSHMRDSLLAEGIMLLICSLGVGADQAVVEAVAQLQERGYHDRVVAGVRVGGSPTLAENAVLAHILGPERTHRIGRVLLEAGHDELAHRFGVFS